MECLCIYIVEIKFLSLMWQLKKNNLLKQFICLVEIPFYAMYFAENVSFAIQQNNFRERSNGLYRLIHHKLFWG